MLETLLVSLNEVCILLLPILGAIVLGYLILILHKVSLALTKAETVLTNVDGKINQLEAPLHTMTTLAHTVDDVHAASVRGVNKAISFLVKHMSTITAWLKDLLEEYNLSNPTQDESKGEE